MSETDKVFGFLAPLSQDYPGFNAWFSKKVIPGLMDGSRKLFCAELRGELAGVGIAKDGREKKICTLRIAPEYEGRGIGIRMLDEMLEWLNSTSPVFTVSERNVVKFDRIFDRYGFRQTSIRTGLYLPSAAEIGFNEP